MFEEYSKLAITNSIKKELTISYWLINVVECWSGQYFLTLLHVKQKWLLIMELFVADESRSAKLP